MSSTRSVEKVGESGVRSGFWAKMDAQSVADEG